MAGRKARFPRLTSDEAHAALHWLHALGKVTSRQIVDALRERERLADEIRRRLEQLGDAGLRFLRGPESLRRRPPRRRASAKARAAWKRQGRYLAAVRRLSKVDRAKIRSIREKSGVGAAIAAAKRMSRP
jgi:hypothetical protein